MTEASTSPDEREHTLPSGLKVTVRSHRALRRADIHAVWAAGNNAEPGLDAAGQHDALMGLLVASTSDPELYPVPLTAAILDRLDGADYTALYRLMDDGWRLANGLSVAPNPDDYQDPKAPTTELNDIAPASGVVSSRTTAPTGTTSTTTTTSTAPEAGAPGR
jgi:hypothetical protein